MSRPQQFEFNRSRGIVWVCDVAGSSSRLNSDNGVEDTEAFLPRLYWVAALLVESAGGKFIKWTGDGFLAWFEMPLHRELQQTVSRCLEALWHLSMIVNVTQLGTASKVRFKIRHGLTYEKDALLTKIIHPSGFETLDLMGRAVVLAFRLSGINAYFPCVATEREIVEAVDSRFVGEFVKWIPNAEESLKYFKGEKWGTKSLYVSREKRSRPTSKKAIAKRVKLAINKAEGHTSIEDAQLTFAKVIEAGLKSGPEWSQQVAEDYAYFLNEGLLKSLKMALSTLESVAAQK